MRTAFIIAFAISCGGTHADEDERAREAALQTECESACTDRDTYDGTALLTSGCSDTAAAELKVVGSGHVTITTGGEPHTISGGEISSVPFTFRCTGGEGRIDVEVNGVSAAGLDITCTELPWDRRLLALFYAQNSRYATRDPVVSGELLLFDKATPLATLDTYGHYAFGQASPTSFTADECVDTAEPVPVPPVVGIAGAPTWTAVDGGAPMGFTVQGEPAVASVTSMAAGTNYNVTIAPQIGFSGLIAADHVRAPYAPTAITVGTQITDGNLMSEAQPGYRLGTFAADATTLPTISWDAEPNFVASTFVRIRDPRIGVAGNPGPKITDCRVTHNSTSWTVPQATFDSWDTTNPSDPSDRISIDLHVCNFATAQLAFSDPGDYFLGISCWVEQNFFLNKTP